MNKNILIYSDLINSLRTVQEAEDISSEIDLLISALFKSDKMSLGKSSTFFSRSIDSRGKPRGFQKVLDKTISSISINSAKKIMEIFSKNNLDINNIDTVRDFLENLKESLKELKIIKLVLAFNPTGATLENIHEFIEENIGHGYILDIEVSESILAGAIVIFKGKYNDFTLRKSLEDAFKLNRSVILNLFQDPNN